MVQVQISGGRKIAPLRFLPFRRQRQEFQFGVGEGFIPSPVPPGLISSEQKKAPLDNTGQFQTLAWGSLFSDSVYPSSSIARFFAIARSTYFSCGNYAKKRRTGE